MSQFAAAILLLPSMALAAWCLNRIVKGFRNLPGSLWSFRKPAPDGPGPKGSALARALLLTLISLGFAAAAALAAYALMVLF